MTNFIIFSAVFVTLAIFFVSITVTVSIFNLYKMKIDHILVLTVALVAGGVSGNVLVALVQEFAL